MRPEALPILRSKPWLPDAGELIAQSVQFRGTERNGHAASKEAKFCRRKLEWCLLLADLFKRPCE